MRRVGDRISEIEQQVKTVELSIHEILMALPNLPRPDVPQGLDEESNIVVRHWGEVVESKFEVIPHWDLGEQLGIIDFERGVKLQEVDFTLWQGLGLNWNALLLHGC
ncbi:MAG: hypothetical protein Ct9H300mP27_04380 [Chloroflexota bacterium]|nr:MAG: hypothetical protein Ct9H300mP27_04380 [Chloroflexota bacterium]